jgi:hypothetical protein
MLTYHCFDLAYGHFSNKKCAKFFRPPKVLVENLIKNLKLEDLLNSLYEED